jgi:hypothetical protein
VQLTFEVVLEAHGLSLEVGSEKAAFDLDLHIFTIEYDGDAL